MGNEEKNKISLKKVIGVIVVVVATAIGGALGGEIPNYFFERSSVGISDEVLSNQANKMNQNLPMMVDSETQLTNVFGADNTFYYYYKLINIKAGDVDIDEFKNVMRDQVLKNYCTNSQMESFKENGVTLRYHYKGKDENSLTEITLTAGECEDI